MSPRLRNLFLTTSALLSLGSSGMAGPDGARVVSGAATVSGQGTSSVTINQMTPSAIINWNTFNIGVGETTRFNQPSSSSVILNRVTGGLGPSVIDGTLSANGRVFIVNGDGILFGPHSVINTASFLATTSDIKNADFMAGRYNFSIPGRTDASIVNQGRITAASGGFAALVAPGVRNSGTITATLGTVALASGNMYTLDLYGDRLIQLGVGDQIASQVRDVATRQPLTSLVSNDGKLKANGGRVELTAATARQVVDSVINNRGVIEANSVGRRNGMIVIGAATASTKGTGAPVQTVRLAGRISASGKGKNSRGGTVVVSGENISLEGARISASGTTGGGKVLIGGEWGGGQPQSGAIDNASAVLERFGIPTASTVSVDAATTIDASARGQGNGGKVVLWSDTQTTFAGTIFARGGNDGGDGGFVETSSHGTLAFTGTVNTLAPQGRAGTLLLDPFDVVIALTGGLPFGGSTFTPSGPTSVLNVSDLVTALGSNNVEVRTTGIGTEQQGNITVATPVTWSGTNTLTLNADHDIAINAAITAAGGGLTLKAGNAIAATAAVNVDTFNLQSGNWSQVLPILPAFSANDFRITGGSFLRAIGGNGGVAPYQLTDVYGLQGVVPGRNYVLANDIDASGTAHWNGVAGFIPIAGTFRDTFDGLGHKIDGLSINSGLANVGLFGVIGNDGGQVRNLKLDHVTIVATNTSAKVGALAGENGGVITNVSVAGSVSGNVTSTGPVTQVGGLVGLNTNFATISDSSSAATVNIGAFTRGGGLVGSNEGLIQRSFSTGTLNADANANEFGGLVGINRATGQIQQSYSSVNVVVTGANAAEFGGLVGENNGHVSNSYATGSVTGGANAAYFAGLVGENDNGTITTSYAKGAVSAGTGAHDFGGLVGINNHPGNLATTGTITNSYWDRETTGQAHSAGSLDSAGLSTADIHDRTKLVGFDFQNVWAPPNALAIQSSDNLTHYAELYGTSHILSVTANDANRLYGDPNPSFSVNGSVFGFRVGDTQTALVAAGLPAALQSTATPLSNVGAYPIYGNPNFVFTGVDGVAYRIVYAGTLTVDQRPITVAASALTRVYGDANPPLTFSTSGLVNGDGVSGSLTTAATTTSNVGNYAITRGSLTASSNYLLNFIGADLTVTPRPLTITADAKGRLYGDANPPLTFGTSGLVNGDGVSGSLTTAATTTSNVGLYPITQGSVTASANYLLNFIGANLAVTPRPLTITADAKSRLYGDANPPLTFGTSGLVNGDLVSGSLTTAATTTSNVGLYPITQGSVTASTNYLLNFVGANLAVTPRPLTITADAKSRLYGDANPPLTFGTSGLVNGDLVSGSLTTAATTTSNVGLYPITQGSVTASTNYLLNFVGANLAVTPRPLTITANNATKPEGQALFFNGNEFTVSGFANNGNNDAVSSVTLTSAGAAASATAAGIPYPIVPSNAQGSGLGNYAITYLNGALTVTPVPMLPPQTQVVLGQNQPPLPVPGPAVVNTQGLNQLPPPPPGGNRPPGPSQNIGPGTPQPPAGFLDTKFFIPPPVDTTTYVSNEVLLYVSASTSPDAIRDALAQLGLTVLDIQPLGSFGAYAVRVNTNGMSVAAAIQALSQLQIAAGATVNIIHYLAQDPAPAARTTETPQGDAGQYILGKLRLSDIHRASRGTNVTIAVVDSEIDGKHPDLEGVVVSRFDATDTEGQPHSHGTGMAGAIASHRRLLGIAPGARILAIRAFSTKTTSPESTTFNILRGMDYAINSGVRIINMSFAGPRDPSLERALKVAHDKGVVLIAAAGNAGPKSPPLYPAADPNVIAVTATDIDDKLFSGANRGRHIAIAAPGVDILVPAPEGSYQLTTGTSVATAHISGIAALLLERNPKLTPDDVRRILTASAHRLGPNNEFGAGLVDPAKALRLADPRSVGFTGSVTR